MRTLRSAGFGIICGLAAVFLATGCQTRASLTRSRMKKVEKGLLGAVVIKGTKVERSSLAERMEFFKVPGVSVVLLDRYEIDWAKAYGYRDIQAYAPVTPDTLFQAGELGQPVAAAAVLSLVDRGGLDLDADARKVMRSRDSLIPEAGAAEAPVLTLRKLLAHASGLGGQVLDGRPRNEPLPSLAGLLEGLRPGNTTGESESGYVVVQQIAADAGGKPFPALAAETVFGPLGLKDSSFEAPLPAALESRAAAGHLRQGPGVAGGWLNYCASASKGLWTTAPDYAGFMLGLVADAMGAPKKMLSPGSARAVLTPQFRNRGFGVRIEGTGNDAHVIVRGRTCGFSSLAMFYPARGQGLVVMTNSDNGGLLADEILRAASAAYEWPDFKPEERPLYRLDPSTYAPYVGRYEISPDYALEVEFEDYYLVVRPTGQARTKFYVESETIFFSVDPFIRIQFRRDDSGVVTGLVLWQEDFEQKAVKAR